MVLTVSFVLFPVIGLFVTVIGGLVRRFNASVEASEPHDFAVRSGTLRLAHLRVHRIPRPTSVTIAIRPSSGCGMARQMPLICRWDQSRSAATQWHDGQIRRAAFGTKEEGCPVGMKLFILRRGRYKIVNSRQEAFQNR
jgi:hypothetical protein